MVNSFNFCIDRGGSICTCHPRFLGARRFDRLKAVRSVEGGSISDRGGSISDRGGSNSRGGSISSGGGSISYGGGSIS